MKPRKQHYDVVVIGAGLIGLCCAWRAKQRGLSVVVIERNQELLDSTSAVAAGMLAPVSEVHFEEQSLLGLHMEAHARWPDFARELELEADTVTGFNQTGTLAVAIDGDDACDLRRLLELQQSRGLDAVWLDQSACRELVPGLPPGVMGGVLAGSDARVDPRAVLRALSRVVDELVLGLSIEEIEIQGDSVTGVRTPATSISCDQVVVAAGCWSPSLVSGVAVRPVKGQIIELQAGETSAKAEYILRTPRCYLVPRGGGRFVLGATVEEQGFDEDVTVSGVFHLLESARELLPEVREMSLTDIRVGFRPTTPDNAPLVGMTEVDGLVVATGHWRHGVLLGPITGDAVADLLAGRTASEAVSPPERVLFGEFV